MIADKCIVLAVQLFANCLDIGLTSCLAGQPPSGPTGPVVIGNGDPDADSGDPPGPDPPGGNPPAEDPPGGDPPGGDPPGGDPPAEEPPGGDPPPPPPPPPGPSAGIWISQAEIQALPTSGPAWSAVRARADAPAGSPDLSNQDQDHNIAMLAKALVYARTGETRYRDEVVAGCMAAIDSERGGRTLALGRELLAYVIAADLVGLDASDDVEFRAWLRRTLTEGRQDLAVYGLAPPQAVLTMTLKDGGERTLHIGDTTPTGGSYYVQRPEEAAIHLVSASAIDQVKNFIGQPPVKPTPTPTLTPTPLATPTVEASLPVTPTVEATAKP